MSNTSFQKPVPPPYGSHLRSVGLARLAGRRHLVAMAWHPIVMFQVLGAVAPVTVGSDSDEVWLTRYDLSVETAAVGVRLPAELREVSGLAVDSHGRLFTHQDETSAVYEVDPGTGSVVRRFHVGRIGLRGGRVSAGAYTRSRDWFHRPRQPSRPRSSNQTRRVTDMPAWTGCAFSMRPSCPSARAESSNSRS